MFAPQTSGLALQGSRTTGSDVRSQNVTAVTAIANIVKSSLGPVGLDKVRRGKEEGREEEAAATAKNDDGDLMLLSSFSTNRIQMLVDDIGDVTITNDGATILKLLEVEHPAAKVRKEKR